MKWIIYAVIVLGMTLSGFGVDRVTRRPVVTQLIPWEAGYGNVVGCTVIGRDGGDEMPLGDLFNLNLIESTKGDDVPLQRWNVNADGFQPLINDTNAWEFYATLSNSPRWNYLDNGNRGDPQFYQSNGVGQASVVCKRGQSVHFNRKTTATFTNIMLRGLVPLDQSFNHGLALTNGSFAYLSSAYPFSTTNMATDIKGAYNDPDTFDGDYINFYYLKGIGTQYQTYGDSRADYAMVYVEEGPHADEFIGPLWMIDYNYDPEDPFRVPDKFYGIAFMASRYVRYATATGTVTLIQMNPNY
jgi:hypothetical protein